MPSMRLQRFLAQAGIAARRKAEVLITDGRVKVNGKTVTLLGSKITPGADRVTVDGKAVHQEELFYAVFNKPKGCITAVNDPEGRRTVMEYMPGLPASAVPVGRLDFYSEGVLLLTNDGALSAALTSSRKAIEKVYHIKLKGSIDEREIQKLREGVRLDYRTVTKPAEVERLKASSRHDWLMVSITEGKNRQLHRMLEAVGHEITKLQRVSFAGLSYHGLRVGDARELTQTELNDLYALTRLSKPKGLTTRGKWVVKRETTEKARRSADRARERVTPNLTPGGSKKAKAKLLGRYREQEEDGTMPAVPVPRVLADGVAKDSKRPHRSPRSKLVSRARPKTTPAKAPGPGNSKSRKTPSQGGKPKPRPATKRSGSKSAGKPGDRRRNATSKSRQASKGGASAGRGARRSKSPKRG